MNRRTASWQYFFAAAEVRWQGEGLRLSYQDILAFLALLTAFAWISFDRWLAVVRTPRRWRLAWFLFCTLQAGLLFYLNREHREQTNLPSVFLLMTAIWHVIVSPITTAAAIMLLIGSLLHFLISRRRGRRSSADQDVAPAIDLPAMTRRKFLVTATAWAPAASTGVLTAVGLTELSTFRVKTMTVQLSSLPEELDGVRIVHFSDTHTGRYTHGQILRETARTINRLAPDLVLFTGDLINDSLRSLPEALGMLDSIQNRDGLFLCEGNHDLIDNEDRFRRTVSGEGFNLLFKSDRIVSIRGVDVLIGGLSWYQGADNKYIPTQVVRGKFRILLSHHPHAVDYPLLRHYHLVLAGHTHGGQLMLTKRLGFGPLLFRYWSGLYQSQPDRALVVSNGIGNWFPLRVNAPAEIVEMTLRRGGAAPARG